MPAPEGLVPVELVDAHSVAKTRGIDIAGPIPSDATVVPGGYSFEAGSDASVWVRAQLASSESVEKRELAHIGIGMFTSFDCLGRGFWVENVEYGRQLAGIYNFYSVGISYRGMGDGEHLDFSRFNGQNYCAVYAYSAGAYTGIGCFNSQPINCFELWR